MARPAKIATPAPNLLDLAPARLLPDERAADGSAILLRPKFLSGPLARWVQPRLGRRAHYRVKLDDLGTFVWDRIDGRTAIGEIALAARAQFGERIEPVYERIALFIQQLEGGGFIAIARGGG